MMDCSDPDTAYWLYEHDRHLCVEFPMYKCCAADPSFAFAKWCLAHQKVFPCLGAEDAVIFAIDCDQRELLVWIHEHRTDILRPEHFDYAISEDQPKIAMCISDKLQGDQTAIALEAEVD